MNDGAIQYDRSGEWLKSNGVPHFSTKERSWAGIPVGFLTIFFLGGFQMGILTRIPESKATMRIQDLAGTLNLWSFGGVSLSVTLLVFSVPLFLTVAWLLGKPLRLALRLPSGDRPSWSRPFWAGLILVASFDVLIVSAAVFLPEVASVVLDGAGWREFVTTVGALLLALVMWNANLWCHPRNRTWRWLLVSIVGVVTVLSVLPLEPTAELVVLMVALVLGVWRSMDWERSGLRSPVGRTGFVPAVSLVAASTVVASFAAGRDLVAPSVAVVVVVVVAAAGAAEVQQWLGGSVPSGVSKPPQGVTVRVFWLAAATCLLPYPCWLWVNFGFAAFAVSVGVNIVSALLIFVWVYFRVGRILGWVVGEVRGRLAEITSSLLGALPVVVLAFVLVLLTTEIWMIAAEVSGPAYWGAIGLLFGVVLLILLVGSWHQVRELNSFKTIAAMSECIAWDQVFCEADGASARAMVEEYEARALVREFERIPARATWAHAKIEWREKWNAVVAAVVLRLVVLVGATAVAFVVLFVLNMLLIPDATASNWSLPSNPCACNASAGELDVVKVRVRVVVLIAMVGMLSLAVQTIHRSVGNSDVANGFNERVDHALREQLVVRRIHRLLQTPPGVPPT